MLGFRWRRLVFGKMGGGTPPGATRPNLPGAAADAFSSPIANTGPARVSAGDSRKRGEKQSGFPVFGPAWRSLLPPAAHASFPTRTLSAVGLRVRRRLNRYSPQTSH